MKGYTLMNRTLKTFSLITAAMMSLALSASSASAGQFHFGASHVTISGSGEDVLTLGAGTLRCKKVTYGGTQATATATTVRVKPSYAECSAFGFVNVPIDVGSCEYELSGDNNDLKIVNCGSNPITVTAFNCWVTISDQTSPQSITYVAGGAGNTHDVRFHANSTTLSYTQHSKSFPGCLKGSFTNGSFTGSGTVKTFDTGGGQVALTRE